MAQNFTPFPTAQEPVARGPLEMRESASAPTEQTSQPEVKNDEGVSPLPEVTMDEVNKEEIVLPEALIQAGIVASGNIDSVEEEIQALPMTDEKIFEGRKAPFTSPVRWLSELCLYILKQGHQTLKKIHGHITRIPMPNI